MTSNTIREVVLPDGPVTISTAPLPWWSEQNGTGFVDPKAIAPDPKNVRRHMSPTKKMELVESIRSHGVQQPLIVTPRSAAPWAKVAPEHAKDFFLAVGGHRRRLCSIEAHVGAVPIHVKLYPSEKEHRLAMSLLNKGNEDLSDLEQGYEILELQSLGWKIVELCRSFGCQAPQLYDRMYLTKLAPQLKKFLDPELPRKKRLSTTVGGALGGIKSATVEELEKSYDLFRDTLKIVPADAIVPEKDIDNLDPQQCVFALQRLLFAVIQARSLGADRAVEFIRERKLQLSCSQGSNGRPAQRYQPKRRKEIVDNFIKGVDGSLCVDWKPEEWRRVFELASREEVEDYVRKFREKGNKLLALAAVLESIAATKRATSSEVMRLLQLGQERRKEHT